MLLGIFLFFDWYLDFDAEVATVLLCTLGEHRVDCGSAEGIAQHCPEVEHCCRVEVINLVIEVERAFKLLPHRLGAIFRRDAAGLSESLDLSNSVYCLRSD